MHGPEAPVGPATTPPHTASGRIQSPGVKPGAVGPPGATPQRAPRWLARSFEVILGCAVFGGGYGSLFGALIGLLIGAYQPESNLGIAVIGALLGTMVGGVCGGFGGVVAGSIGLILGGGWGWLLAAALGGLPIAACYYVVTTEAGDSTYWEWLAGRLWLAGPVMIGALLGCALCLGLRRGRSVVPGVMLLAATITDGTSPLRATGGQGETAEVTPSAAPAGRGDELAPEAPNRRDERQPSA